LAFAGERGLHVEKFMYMQGDRYVWVTDQTCSPVAAVPPWAAVRGWN
jgi:hypothetical protein